MATFRCRTCFVGREYILTRIGRPKSQTTKACVLPACCANFDRVSVLRPRPTTLPAIKTAFPLKITALSWANRIRKTETDKTKNYTGSPRKSYTVVSVTITVYDFHRALTTRYQQSENTMFAGDCPETRRPTEICLISTSARAFILLLFTGLEWSFPFRLSSFTFDFYCPIIARNILCILAKNMSSSPPPLYIHGASLRRLNVQRCKHDDEVKRAYFILRVLRKPTASNNVQIRSPTPSSEVCIIGRQTDSVRTNNRRLSLVRRDTDDFAARYYRYCFTIVFMDSF